MHYDIKNKFYSKHPTVINYYNTNYNMRSIINGWYIGHILRCVAYLVLQLSNMIDNVRYNINHVYMDLKPLDTNAFRLSLCILTGFCPGRTSFILVGLG